MYCLKGTVITIMFSVPKNSLAIKHQDAMVVQRTMLYQVELSSSRQVFKTRRWMLSVKAGGRRSSCNGQPHRWSKLKKFEMVPVADAKVSLLETVLSERGGLVAVTKEAGVGASHHSSAENSSRFPHMSGLLRNCNLNTKTYCSSQRAMVVLVVVVAVSSWYLAALVQLSTRTLQHCGDFRRTDFSRKTKLFLDSGKSPKPSIYAWTLTVHLLFAFRFFFLSLSLCRILNSHWM